MSGKFWTDDEELELRRMYDNGLTARQISETVGRSLASIENKIKNLRSVLPPSVMPKFDKPLTAEGDALILTDLEAPYQHTDFVNRVLDLADTWKIKTLILGGDILHYHNLSKWGAEWLPDAAETEKLDALYEFVNSLPQKHRDNGISLIEKIGDVGSGNGGLSDELAESRRVFRGFSSFQKILVALGNHDDRYLRAIDKAIRPNELLVQIDRNNDTRWEIAPYYFAMLETSGGRYRIEHPRGAGRAAAQDLAVQYHCHIVMGHSHRWAVNRDPSGKFWAIQSGHCVDEERLAYAATRSAKRDAHCLGATIIRDGYPFVLGEWTPFDLLKKI